MASEKSPANDELWRDVFTNPRNPIYQATKLQSKIFKHFGTDPRCRVCKVSLSETPGALARMVGKERSEYNPHFCNSCELWTREHKGGAEVYMSALFADVRGSTTMAEQLGAKEFAAVMDRFYSAATKVLNRSDGMVDRPAGDEVRAFYVPVYTKDHAKSAVTAGMEILKVTGHDDPDGPWVPVGVGVHSGIAHIGSMDLENGQGADIAVLGDAINVSARLSSVSRAGELLISGDAYRESGLGLAGVTSREVEIRGRAEPLEVVSFSLS